MIIIKNTDAGRSKSKRSKQQNDCAVRAFAIAAEISYDEAYDMVAKATGRKSGRGTPNKPWKKFIESIVVNGYRFRWISFPAIKGKVRVNCETFAEMPEAKRAIVSNPKHLYASINGVVHDEADEFNAAKCVYGCWIAEKV